MIHWEVLVSLIHIIRPNPKLTKFNAQTWKCPYAYLKRYATFIAQYA